MLPFPIFLFLLISATLLAPPPPAFVGSFKISTLRPFEWSFLHTSIPDLGPQSSPEDAAFPLGMPLVTLNPLPTQCYPNSTLVANNTVPHSFIRATDDRTHCTAVLLVVSLAILSCFVYRLLVNRSSKSHDVERKSERFTRLQFSSPAAPPQESTHHCILAVDEAPHHPPSIDTAKHVSEGFEDGRLPYSTQSPSIPSFATTILPRSPAPPERSLSFPVISHGFLLDGSGKSAEEDSMPASGYALIDTPSVFAAQTDEAPTKLEAVVRIDDSDVGLPECIPLDMEAAEVVTLPLLDLSNISHPRNPGASGELQDDSMSSPVIEDACELDADEEDVFCYQPSNSEANGDETLDFIPRLRFRSRGHSLDSASSFSPKKSASEVVNAIAPSPRLPFLLDCTSVGQPEGEITSITRCASAGDLGSTFGASNAAHAYVITDRPNPTFRCDIIDFDDTVHDQVTTLSLLRADAPIFKPRSPAVNGVASLEPFFVGLEASIHPRNEILQMQGHVEVLDATANPPESPIESGSFQTYIEAVEEPKSSGNAQITESVSPKVTDGVHASIHAPQSPSTGTIQALEDNTKNLENEPHFTTLSSSTRNGLYASIHAPAAGQSGQSVKRSYHTDVPNWAAICRAEKSSTEGSLAAKCGGNSPDSAATLDESALELPTATRCAASDQERSSVDGSDGSSLVHADDQEDTTISSGETDSSAGEVDVPDTGTGTKPSRKSRRRGGRRTRQKIPYVPPPRMQNIPVAQHQVAQGPGQTRHVLAAPAASLSKHHYTHVPPTPPYNNTSSSGLMIPPNGTMYDQFGRYPRHYYPSPSIPGFQPPGPHNPMFYPFGPHPHVSPHAPSTLLYGQ